MMRLRARNMNADYAKQRIITFHISLFFYGLVRYLKAQNSYSVPKVRFEQRESKF